MRNSVARNFNSSILIYLLIVVLVITNYVHPSGSGHSKWSKDMRERVVDRLMDTVSLTLPYNQYVAKRDSIRYDLINDRSDFRQTGTWNFFSLSSPQFSNDDKHLYYIGLAGYECEDALFYHRNGKDYMDYTVWTNVTEFSKSGYRESKETNIRYNENTESDNIVLIPVSKTLHYVLKTIVIAGIILMALGFFCFLFYLPFRFLLLVARGEIFNDETIAILFYIARFLIIVGLLASLIKIVFHLIFRSRIPSPITFSWYDAIMQGWQFVTAGLIVLLLAKSFLKGSQLQYEQDLTV